jgi:hypothetical protein
MEGEVGANPDLDVTIYLVQKLITEQAAGSASNKRRRMRSCDGIYGLACSTVGRGEGEGL